MFEIISFVIAIVILGVTAFFSFKNRFKTKGCISIIMIGILITSFFMVLPIYFKDVVSIADGLYALLESLIFALKTLGGGQDHEIMVNIDFSGWVKAFYLIINYICFIACPLITSSLILSFIGDTFDKIRYALALNKKCYVFSSLNEKSLNLLKSMGKKGVIVFCNTKDCGEALKTRARKLGSILLYCSSDNLKLIKNKEYRFYLIEDQQDNNIEFAQKLINKHQAKGKNKVIIYAFTESGANVSFLESLITENSTVEIRCIDEIALMCNDLIFKHPLYNIPKEHKDISVALVGLGKYGMRMLKTVFWAGQIDGYNLKIRAYDKNADTIYDKLIADCPELENQQTIKFIKVDVDSANFKNEILKPENSLDATYIVVAMGDDQLNLTVSDELYRLFRRKNNFSTAFMPQIFTRVRSDIKSNSFFKNAEFLQKRNIHLFGTVESIYSSNTLFNSDLENLALAVHLTYWGALQKEKGTKEFKTVYTDFKTKEYDRRASMAAALHIPAKLVASGVMDKSQSVPAEKDLDEFALWINDSKNLEKLAENEHARWNAFMASEGYISTDFESIKKYAPFTKSHKDDLSKSHPCIIPWKDLDALEKEYNILAEANGYKKGDFKKYDREIVEKIPEIFKVARNLNKEK